jgi:hypothetical protein
LCYAEAGQGAENLVYREWLLEVPSAGVGVHDVLSGDGECKNDYFPPGRGEPTDEVFQALGGVNRRGRGEQEYNLGFVFGQLCCLDQVSQLGGAVDRDDVLEPIDADKSSGEIREPTDYECEV